ncbi:MAG: hypothetical protein WBB25_10420 [Sulfitobacter sp.]
MIRTSLVCVAVLSIAGCGGGSSYASKNARGYGAAPSVVVQFARGPIQQACQSGGRKAASHTRCGCVQAVANQTLSGADQRRGAQYFKNPHKLQEVRQSDNAGNERFWKVWKEFGQSAGAVCGGS